MLNDPLTELPNFLQGSLGGRCYAGRSLFLGGDVPSELSAILLSDLLVKYIQADFTQKKEKEKRIKSIYLQSCTTISKLIQEKY